MEIMCDFPFFSAIGEWYVAPPNPIDCHNVSCTGRFFKKYKCCRCGKTVSKEVFRAIQDFWISSMLERYNKRPEFEKLNILIKSSEPLESSETPPDKAVIVRPNKRTDIKTLFFNHCIEIGISEGRLTDKEFLYAIDILERCIKRETTFAFWVGY